MGDIVESDSVYYFNTYHTNQKMWWCSSASQTTTVQKYHNVYIQSQQSILRDKNQKILVESYVTQQARYICTSNLEQDQFVMDLPLSHIRGNQIQPTPLHHFHWLMQSIVPIAKLRVDNSLSQKLLARISNHVWIPYDPDREKIWHNMLAM